MSVIGMYPNPVLFSKKLTDSEKVLYFAIEHKKCAGDYCTATNEELAKILGTNAKTISTRLASLKKKKYAHTYFNDHLHKRYIYLDAPWEPTEDDFKTPTSEQIKEKEVQIEKRSQRVVLSGAFDMSTLIHKFISVFNGYQQTNKPMNDKQKKFLEDFKKNFPNKAINCNVADFPEVDYNKLIKEIKNSDFLPKANNLSLKWCLEHSKEIINGDWRKIRQSGSNFKGRNSEDFDIEDLFPGLDDINI